jgi:hypothetical protein
MKVVLFYIWDGKETIGEVLMYKYSRVRTSWDTTELRSVLLQHHNRSSRTI